MLRLQADNYDVLIEDVALPYAGYKYVEGLPPIYDLGDGHHSSAEYLITSQGPESETYKCILIGDQGATRVYDESAVLVSDLCIVAVSAYLVALQLPDLQLKWSTEVDWATCFGVYHLPAYQSLFTHGELTIARIAYDGEILWQNGGKDIFTGDFTLFDTYAEVVDFNDERYHIDLETGRTELIV